MIDVVHFCLVNGKLGRWGKEIAVLVLLTAQIVKCSATCCPTSLGSKIQVVRIGLRGVIFLASETLTLEIAIILEVHLASFQLLQLFQALP